MSRSMLFQRPVKLVFYTSGLFQIADREMAKSKMGEEERKAAESTFFGWEHSFRILKWLPKCIVRKTPKNSEKRQKNAKNARNEYKGFLYTYFNVFVFIF